MTDDSQSTDSPYGRPVLLDDPDFVTQSARNHAMGEYLERLDTLFRHERESEEILNVRLSNQQWSKDA